VYRRIASLRDAAALRAHCAALGIELPCDDAPLSAPASPLATPLAVDDRVLANRFVIQPMEGWDGTSGGEPSELTRRRWRNFGRSGAAWIWGGEAVAVRADGRANPHQLVLTDATAAAIGSLRRELLDAWRETADGSPPWIGLQLTHSGRWARPGPSGAAPRVAFRHPLLDRRVGIVDDTPVLSDTEVEALIAAFARAARLAQEEGFEFVDLKHCHGYLLHEFLAARRRGGSYGGAALARRLRLLHELIGAVRAAAPRLVLAVRLSVFDGLPHRPAAADGRGVAEDTSLPYECGFGLDASSPERIDLTEPIAFVRALAGLGIRLLNVTAGSPYYVPHLQRPALFPPSDGYQPPEDPLVGVARLLGAARDMKTAVPEMTVVSTGWSYLQEFIPHVAQACLRDRWFDAVGLGRMALAYPELPADVLAGRPLERRRLCRTFSDCTTAPRNGLVSGCYPLDPFYRAMPERERLERVKQLARSSER
jgi:2,4-dienoyl-CoA reductase-like NADH-dependent reductase (Old Yellow Enzyme family)